MVPISRAATEKGGRTPTITPINNSTSNEQHGNATWYQDTVHSHFAGNIIQTSSKAELAAYHHQSLGSPPISAILRAMKNHPDELASFPGLDEKLIKQHLEPSTATQKGHMVRTRQGLRSTKGNRQQVLDAREEVNDMAPQQQICSAIDDEMFCYSILRSTDGNTIYSDLTERFPIESYTGMNYIFVCYIYKLNAILLRPMKSRKEAEMIKAFESCYDELNAKGHHPTLHVLDNECSLAVKQYLQRQRTDIQFVEAHNHKVNAA